MSPDDEILLECHMLLIETENQLTIDSDYPWIAFINKALALLLGEKK